MLTPGPPSSQKGVGHASGCRGSGRANRLIRLRHATLAAEVKLTPSHWAGSLAPSSRKPGQLPHCFQYRRGQSQVACFPAPTLP